MARLVSGAERQKRQLAKRVEQQQPAEAPAPAPAPAPPPVVEEAAAEVAEAEVEAEAAQLMVDGGGGVSSAAGGGLQQSLLQEVDIDPAAPTLSATLLQEVAMAAPFGMSEEDEVDMISRSAM